MNLAGIFHTRVYELKTGERKIKQPRKKVKASGTGEDSELAFFTQNLKYWIFR